MIEVRQDLVNQVEPVVEAGLMFEFQSDGTANFTFDFKSEVLSFTESRLARVAAAPFYANESFSVVEARTDSYKTNVVEVLTELITVSETRTTQMTQATAGAETLAVTESRVSYTGTTNARTETVVVSEARFDSINVTGGLQTTDHLSELIRLSGDLPPELSPLQLAENPYEEDEMPGNVVSMTGFTATTTPARVDATAPTGRIRVRIINTGSQVVYVASSSGVSATTGDPIDPQGGMWEQYWTQAVQIWVVASGGSQPCVLTQVAVQ